MNHYITIQFVIKHIFLWHCSVLLLLLLLLLIVSVELANCLELSPGLLGLVSSSEHLQIVRELLFNVRLDAFCIAQSTKGK